MARAKNQCPNREPGSQRSRNNAGRCSCSSSSTSSLSTGRRRSSSSSSDDSVTWTNFNKRMRSAPEANRSGAGPSGQRRPSVAVQAPPQRRRRRRRPGELVLQEIRRLANTTYPLLPLAPFSRVVHEIMQQVAPPWLGPQLRHARHGGGRGTREEGRKERREHWDEREYGDKREESKLRTCSPQRHLGCSGWRWRRCARRRRCSACSCWRTRRCALRTPAASR